MEWQYVVILIVMIPVILFPAAFVWFLNVSGAVTAWKESQARAAKGANARKGAVAR